VARPLRLKLTRERTALDQGRAEIFVARIEGSVALPWLGWAFAVSTPYEVMYRGPSGLHRRRIIDSVFAARALFVAGLVAFAFVSRRRGRPARNLEEGKDDFTN
jgi:hypothetical protein